MDTVFVGRKPVTRLSEGAYQADKNLITGRIMRLRGLEPGVNAGGDVDTFSRYVYIHGTNRKELIGTPCSSGCILLADADLEHVFQTVPDGSLVLIEAE